MDKFLKGSNQFSLPIQKNDKILFERLKLIMINTFRTFNEGLIEVTQIETNL